MSKSDTNSRKSAQDDISHSQLLASSARGATFLISLQIGSRALTFIVNQILLRYLSPELLGISAQLDLFAISVLYFSRESLRVALSRLGGAGQDDSNTPKLPDSENQERKPPKIVEDYAVGRKAQEVVNLSWIAVVLGPPLAYFFATTYLRRAEPKVVATPYFRKSLYLYAIATVLELFNEPCFMVTQQQMLFSVRATGEASATFAKCFVTCAMAVWAGMSRRELGVLPFAIGQLSYAAVLNAVYLTKLWNKPSNEKFSLSPKPMTLNSSAYLLSYFSRPMLTLALNLYAQSGLKHLLTQGDSLLIALFTDLPSQGVYALASNYGSLLARILFQPVEESSRGVFARLLPPTASASSTPHPLPAQSVLAAHRYLLTILYLYSLLTLLLTTIAPTLAPLLLRYVAGPAWTSTTAGSVLSVYCYYIPLLAVNGVLEALVAAVATPAQLRTQSAWMLVFTMGFVGAGWVSLRLGKGGAKGLIVANGVNMGMRILWSAGFVRRYFGMRGVEVDVRQVFPSVESIALGMGVAWWLRFVRVGFGGGVTDLVKTVVIGGCYGLAV